MNNFTSIFVAILEHLELITKEDAKKLIKELHGTTLPDTYEGASNLVKTLFNKHDVKVKQDISNLDARITSTVKAAIDPFIQDFKVVPKKVDTPKS